MDRERVKRKGGGGGDWYIYIHTCAYKKPELLNPKAENRQIVRDGG